MNLGDLLINKDKNIHEIKNDLAKKKQFKAEMNK